MIYGITTRNADSLYRAKIWENRTLSSSQEFAMILHPCLNDLIPIPFAVPRIIQISYRSRKIKSRLSDNYKLWIHSKKYTVTAMLLWHEQSYLDSNSASKFRYKYIGQQYLEVKASHALCSRTNSDWHFLPDHQLLCSPGGSLISPMGLYQRIYSTLVFYHRF